MSSGIGKLQKSSVERLACDPRQGLRSTKRKIAFITPDLFGPVTNGGIGTSCASLAIALAEIGHVVSVLYCGPRVKAREQIFWRDYYKKKNCELSFLSIEKPRKAHLWDEHLAKSIFRLLAKSSFDIVHFADFRGLGYYVLRAKKNGVGFKKTHFCVVAHGPSCWIRKNNGLSKSRSLRSRILDRLERGTVELADTLVYPSFYAADVISNLGWKVPRHSFVEYNVPLRVAKRVRKITSPRREEIVFFGRVETRKGIGLFIEAINLLPLDVQKKLTVTFLGNWGQIQGRSASLTLPQMVKSWVFRSRFLTGLNREEAWKYLILRRPLVVIPSLAETMGYTVMECLQTKTHFLASNIPPFRELVPSESQKAILFDLNAPSLKRQILVALASSRIPATSNHLLWRSSKKSWQNWHSRLVL